MPTPKDDHHYPSVSDDRQGLGLVEFLADLREELAAAQQRALDSGGDLRLGVEEITVSLDVAHVKTISGEVSTKAGGKFWVFASAEVGGKGAMGTQRTGTQTLTLKLRPGIEQETVDESGHQTTVSRGLDVADTLRSEQNPEYPAARAPS